MTRFRRRRAVLSTAKLLPDAAVETALRAMGRRGGRVLAWLIVVASPVVMLGGLVLLRPSVPDARPQEVQEGALEPAGWAEMYVRSWLSASRTDSAGIEAFYPPGMKTQRGVGTQVPVDVAALAVNSPTPGTWSITLAVNVLTQQPDGKHAAKVMCVQVGLAEGADAHAYVAMALPAPVTCPATLAGAGLAYLATAELDGPIGQSVSGFLSAYLTGSGDLDRYVAPGAGLAPVTPSPYSAVQLVELRTHEQFEPGQAARPLDRTETRVLARAWGYDATGESTVVDYALTLAARAGRWEVSRIDPSPLLAATPSAAAPTATPSPSTTPIAAPVPTRAGG